MLVFFNNWFFLISGKNIVECFICFYSCNLYCLFEYKKIMNFYMVNKFGWKIIMYFLKILMIGWLGFFFIDWYNIDFCNIFLSFVFC